MFFFSIKRWFRWIKIYLYAHANVSIIVIGFYIVVLFLWFSDSIIEINNNWIVHVPFKGIIYVRLISINVTLLNNRILNQALVGYMSQYNLSFVYTLPHWRRIRCPSNYGGKLENFTFSLILHKKTGHFLINRTMSLSTQQADNDEGYVLLAKIDNARHVSNILKAVHFKEVINEYMMSV